MSDGFEAIREVLVDYRRLTDRRNNDLGAEALRKLDVVEREYERLSGIVAQVDETVGLLAALEAQQGQIAMLRRQNGRLLDITFRALRSCEDAVEMYQGLIERYEELVQVLRRIT